MPKISVIIPAFNAEATILETIQSIQKQTFQDFEILVVDDGSTDRTLEIVRAINDPRIKSFSFPNGGVSVARNRGIEAASGEFLSFIDNDDLWTHEKLAMQLKALEQNPNAHAAYSWTVNMIDDGQSISFVQGAESTCEGNIYPDLLIGNFIASGSNILIRREVVEVIGGFEPNLAFSDWDFYLRIAAKFNFVVVPKPQILYRKISGSMSSKSEKMEREGLIALERAFAMAPQELQYLKKRSLASLYRYCADLWLSHSSNMYELKYAQEKLIEAIKLNPAILSEKYTQRLLIKLLVNKIPAGNVSTLLVQSLKKLTIRPDPRYCVGLWLLLL